MLVGDTFPWLFVVFVIGLVVDYLPYASDAAAASAVYLGPVLGIPFNDVSFNFIP